MLHLVIFSCLVSSTLAGTTAAISDTNCTTSSSDGPAYTFQATACYDTVSPDICTSLFGAAPSPAISPGVTAERPTKCYQNAASPAAPSEDAKNAAIAACPKYCGYCCLTPAYNCENAKQPRIDCSKIVQAQCTDPKWIVQIAQDCPNVCGLCLSGGCIDAAQWCSTQPAICFTKGYEQFVADNCQKTCGLCSNSTSTTPHSSASCGDNGANCANWVRNGFCTSSFYSTTQKQQYCGRSCGMC